MGTKKIILYCFIMTTGLLIHSQNQVQLTNYSQIKTSFNPAFCGNDNTINLTMLARQQWIGFDEAPSTQMITFDTYCKKLKGGIGFTIINDALGKENSIRFKTNYSYKYILSRSTYISAGIGFGILHISYDALTLVYEELDPNGTYNSISAYVPDFDAGLMAKFKLLTLGISLSKTYDNLNNDVEINIPYYIHTYVDYTIPVSRKININPTLYWHKTAKISTFNTGSNITVSDKIWAGITYRFNESLNGMIGYQLTERLRLGYSYDFTLGGLHSYNTGSHEIYLKLIIQKRDKLNFYHKSPRFF